MTTERERKLFHNCKVVEKTEDEYNGQEVWKVTVDKEVFGGQYPTVLTRVDPAIANRLERGKQYSLILERQNKKKADHSGERDWMFYWGLVGIADGAAAQQAARATDGAAPRQQTTTTSESWGSLDERIAWNSAINNAVHATPYAEMMLNAWIREVDDVANSLYPLIRRGPLPPAEDVPQGSPEAPDEDGEGALHPEAEDVSYIMDALDSQNSIMEI
jgi:hypothetical protein